MSTIDIILAVLLGIGAIKGYRQGLILEIFSILAFFVGLFLALELTLPVAQKILGSSSYFEVGAVVIFIALFVLLSLLIKAGAKAIKSVIDFTLLGTLDNIAGALAGVLKWAFLVSVVFWVFDSVGFGFVDRFANDGYILPYIVGIGPAVFEWVSLLVPMVKDLLDSMENLTKNKDSVLTLAVIK